MTLPPISSVPLGADHLGSALASAVAVSPDAVLLVDAAGVIRWANDGAVTMLGDDLVARDAWTLLEAEARDRIQPRVLEHVRAEGRWIGDVRVAGRSAPLPVRLAVLAATGALPPVHGVWHLTRLDPLDFRQDELRELIDALPIGVFLNGPDGRCQWVNATYASLTGLSRDTLLGDGWQRALVGDRDAYAAEVARSIAELGRFGPTEVRYRGAAGDERCASVRIRALHDDAGQVRGQAGVVADITEIRNSRLALAASEERLRTLLATIDEGIVMQDAAGEICLWNAAAERILGMTGDQLVGRSSLDPSWRTVDADGRPLAGEDHPSMVTLRTGRPVRGFVMGVMRGDALRTWIRVTSLPIALPGERGGPGVVVSFVDITAQREAESRTTVRERLGGVAHFAGQLAHEFANALMVVQARLELVQARGVADTVEDLEAAEQAVRRATELTSALRALGGREATTVERVELRALLDALASEWRGRAGAKVSVQPPVAREGETPLPVTTDPALLRAVLATILTHHGAGAVDADGVAETEAPITLSVEVASLLEPLVERHGEVAAGDWAIVRCRRESRGLAEAALASLLAPDFASRHAARAEGVDLPVALARMQRLRGHLSASRVGATGSEVLLWLPMGDPAGAQPATAPPLSSTRLPDEVEPAAQPRTRRTPWIAGPVIAVAGDPFVTIPRPPEPAIDLQGLHVLLVDDDPLVLRTAERLLQRVGCVVSIATNGTDAATMLASSASRIDLLVTDVVMPGLTGPALVAQLRDRGDERPVVYMSGYTGDAFSAAAALDEDAILVAKPFTSATLVSAIREALGGAGRRPD